MSDELRKNLEEDHQEAREASLTALRQAEAQSEYSAQSNYQPMGTLDDYSGVKEKRLIESLKKAVKEEDGRAIRFYEHLLSIRDGPRR